MCACCMFTVTFMHLSLEFSQLEFSQTKWTDSNVNTMRVIGYNVESFINVIIVIVVKTAVQKSRLLSVQENDVWCTM